MIKLEKPIVLTEFPKSGGSWIVSLIGDSLNIAKRDIYVRPGFDLFNIQKHPWYQGLSELDFPTQSVIKSHELPHSNLITFDAKYIHLVRDGRDVITSKWFFEKEFCVKNGLTSSFDQDFDSYVEEQATLWSEYINSWDKKAVYTIRYEDFLKNPNYQLSNTIKVIIGYDLKEEVIKKALDANTKESFSNSMNDVFKHNTFVRKGVSGDWKLHFSEKNIQSFNAIAGKTLSALGYLI